MRRIGKVVKSNNHCDYVIEIDDRLSVKDPPEPEDYGFGSFLKLESKDRHWGVGIIYNTQLSNPAFLNSGPRLSTEPSPIYAPDLQTEIRTLVSVVLIGTLEPPERIEYLKSESQVKKSSQSGGSEGLETSNGRGKSKKNLHVYGYQGIPRVVVPVNTLAYTMGHDEIYQFHQDRMGKAQFAYYGLLLNCGGIFANHLIYQVLNEISPMFHDHQQKRALEILSKELSWKMTMGTMR